MLSVTPQEILRWRESEFLLWFRLLLAGKHDDHVAVARALAVATWAPDKLDKAKEEPEDPARAIERALEIDRMAKRHGVKKE